MATTDSASASSIAVLIADDHHLVREALRRTLLRAGMRVLAEACTPFEALEHARHPRVEIVILDLSWRTCPAAVGRDAGLATLLWVRAERPSLPVLIYSADGSAQTVESCRRLGANGYLIKGVDDSRLIAAVRAVHAGERVWPSGQEASARPGVIRTLSSLVDSTSSDGGAPDSTNTAQAPA